MNEEEIIENDEVSTDTNENNTQQDSTSNTNTVELVDYQSHVTQSLDNIQTMFVCQFIFLGVIVGVLLAKSLWRRLTV